MPVSALGKLIMLEDPKSEVWTYEDRMAPKFTKACFDNTITDELFEQARSTWGEQKLLRHISLIGFVLYWAILGNVLDMKFVPEIMTFPRGSMNPEFVGMITSKPKDTKEKVREFWGPLVNFIE